jgi:hypothetical protein
MCKFPSFEPVASLVPSGENLQNHTSSVWSVNVWIVTQGNVCLEEKSIIKYNFDFYETSILK